MFKAIGVVVVLVGVFFLGKIDFDKKVVPVYKSITKSETAKSIKKDAKRIFTDTNDKVK